MDAKGGQHAPPALGGFTYELRTVPRDSHELRTLQFEGPELYLVLHELQARYRADRGEIWRDGEPIYRLHLLPGDVWAFEPAV